MAVLNYPAVGLVLTAALVFSGCSNALGAADKDDCVTKYAIPAGTERAARYAYGFCAQAFDPATQPEQKTFVTCMLPKLAAARSDLAIQAAAAVCNKQR